MEGATDSSAGTSTQTAGLGFFTLASPSFDTKDDNLDVSLVLTPIAAKETLGRESFLLHCCYYAAYMYPVHVDLVSLVTTKRHIGPPSLKGV